MVKKGSRKLEATNPKETMQGEGGGGGGGGERARAPSLIIKFSGKPPPEKEEAAPPPHPNTLRLGANKRSSPAEAWDPPHRQEALNKRNEETAAPLPQPQRHWNLRARGKIRSFIAAETGVEDGPDPPHQRDGNNNSSPQQQNVSKREEKKPTFRSTLTNAEIEADFIAMTGHMPRRPVHRRKVKVQKVVEDIVPGSNLPKTINANRYRVSKSSY